MFCAVSYLVYLKIFIFSLLKRNNLLCKMDQCERSLNLGPAMQRVFSDCQLDEGSSEEVSTYAVDLCFAGR